MSYLYIIYTSSVSFVVLFLLAKIIGNKQLSQLNMFDYINGITIGSIAAEAATALDKNFTHCILAMVIYGIFTFAISFICAKSVKINRIISGKSIPLVCMDKIYYKNLKKARIDLSELLTQLRCMGYFNIADVAFAYLEANGKISVLPKEDMRPYTVGDSREKKKQSKPSITLVSDGTFLYENIKQTDVTKERIMKEALNKGAKDENDILLATYKDDGNICIYIKTADERKNDLFG